jgi:hypothetical protein
MRLGFTSVREQIRQGPGNKTDAGESSALLRITGASRNEMRRDAS